MHHKDHDRAHGTPPYDPGIREDPRARGECTAVLGNMTGALQAQRALANAAIYSTVTKVSSSKNTGGCAYGVVYPCAQERNVRAVLSRADITVKKYLGG